MSRIVVEVSDRIATATISAPPMNALDAAMRAELAEQLQKFEEDDRVRAVVLRGDGSKAFCAGASVCLSFWNVPGMCRGKAASSPVRSTPPGMTIVLGQASVAGRQTSESFGLCVSRWKALGSSS